MFNSNVLELGVGLTLFFLLVSLICSAAREGVETVLKSRARDLERGMRALLDDPGGQTLMRSVMQHGQIASLMTGDYAPEKLTKPLFGGVDVRHMPVSQRGGLPSYIPAKQFAAALLDIVARGDGVSPYPVSSAPVSLDQLRAQAGSLPSVKLQRVVLNAVDYADGELEAARKQIEAWFDGSMDRVSGWYKRRTQLILFGMGLFAAAAMNLDTLAIANRLNSDEALRQAAVAAAGKLTQENATAPQDVSVQQAQSSLKEIGYPIGWLQTPSGVAPFQVCDPPAAPDAAVCRNPHPTTGRWLTVLLGWLITAAAASFGAPFWFDVLNKFMVVRSTVKPTQKSADEAPAEPTAGDDGPDNAPHAPAQPQAAAPGAAAPAAPPAPLAGQPPPPPEPSAAEALLTPEAWRDDFENPFNEVAL